MPNRGIKESICTSKTLSKLSAEAERLFYHILVNCDDHGRMEADTDILIAKCFPRNARKISDQQMESWLKELSNELLVVYINNDTKYLEFVTWEKHNRIRANDSKYPGPLDAGSKLLTLDNTCWQMKTDDGMCQQTPTNENNCGYTRDTNLDIDNDINNDTNSTHTRKPQKNKYADFVSLTNDEYQSLVAKLGSEDAVNRCIEILDNYKGANGKRYKSDYRAILNWVIDRFQGEQQKSKLSKRDQDELERRRLAEEYDRRNGERTNPGMQSQLPSVFQC